MFKDKIGFIDLEGSEYTVKVYENSSFRKSWLKLKKNLKNHRDMREAKGVIFLLALYFFSIFIYKMKIFFKKYKE